MAFASINRQFTLSTFTAYLSRLAPPAWAKGSAYHNTYRPTEEQWRGLASMQSMQAAYEAKGWTSGPHVFLALGSPNPTHDGLWVMTPPTQPGTHAGDCNSGFFGIEVVGDFQAELPNAAQQELLIDTLAALHRWARLGPVLVAHRDCMLGRTCPGDAFYALKPQLQAKLATALNADPLRARMLPGPNGTVHYCGTGFYDLYHAHSGFSFFGYALTDEAAALGQDGRPCTWMLWERAVAKYVEGDGVRLALLSEARALGWLP